MSMNALLLLPILAAAPYAIIETRYVDKTDPNNFQVMVRALDGQAYWHGLDEIKITPEVHFIEMTAAGSSTNVAKKNYDKSLYINAKPCFRYLVTGQLKNSLDSDWVVRVIGAERISACKTHEEIEQGKIDKKTKSKDKLIKKQAQQSELPHIIEVTEKEG